ncbi:ROK family glucokinase [Blautia schinkii]|nr:ROK family glucokinase [Blautia schinkii]
MYRIGIDLGGTNIAVGILNQEMKIVHRASIPTDLPQKPETLADRIAELVFQMLKETEIPAEAVISAGIGIPGTVNPHNGMVEYANNLDFIQVPFSKILGRFFPFPLYGVNDAKAAAWGEYVAGAGKGSSSMMMVTLGTGIGGAMIINGKIVDGFNFAAGEIGHMVIEHNGRLCNCGRRGCFEVYASATALVEEAERAALACRDSLLYKVQNGASEKINGKVFFDAVRKGDETAASVLEWFTGYLSVGICNLVNIFQPEILCIGGGISSAGEILFAPLREKVYPLVYSRDSEINTKIAGAKLGNDAGIIGAAGLESLNYFM